MRLKNSSILFVILLIFSLALSACSKNKNSNNKENSPEASNNFNETDYPIVDEPITLQIMGKSSPVQPQWGDMGFFSVMEELTNINFKYRTSSAEDFVENKQLAFNTLDLPDLFYGADLTSGEESDYGSQGLLIPLEDLIDKYAPNFKQLMEDNPEIEPSITTPDGHIYALPGIDSSQTSQTPIMWLNGKWLEALNADKPETMEEFYELLKQFKEENPGNVDNVIPLTANEPSDLREGLLPNFGIVQDDGIYEEDDVVKYAWVQDEFKEYLKYLNRLYEEKLLDNDMFSHTWEQFVAKGDRTGVLSTWPIVQVGFEDPAEALNYPVLGPMTSVTNDEKLVKMMSDIRRGRAAITKDNEHPEATMRWIDHAYSEEGTILARLGIEDETFIWNDEGQWELLADEGLSTTETNAKHAPGVGTNVPMVLTEEFFEKEGGNPTILEIYDWVSEELIPYAELPYPLVYFTEEEQNRVSALKPDIDTYFEQMEAKFITGAESIDEAWDNFVKTLEDLGIGEVVEIHQAAYDRWLEAE